jgi:hypothetical protein
MGPCGSGLARDGGVSVNEDVGSDGLFASKLAPTGILLFGFYCVLIIYWFLLLIMPITAQSFLRFKGAN